MIDAVDLTMHLPATTDDRPLRLLQITDCHIFADPAGCLQGINTRRSIGAVCDRIVEREQAFDALLATGDLSQDGSAKSYRFLADQFARFAAPTFWIPGNHDDSATMRENLRAPNIHHHRLLLSQSWVIIMLDSTIAGIVSGQVGPAQLEFLDTALQRFAHRHALVCLHHQAMDIGSRWIDQKGLENPGILHDLLARHANVRGVVWGHVHQQSDRDFDGIRWMSTPSSCVQFKPGAEEFCVDDAAPGYRCLSLHPDGHIETRVERVDAELGCD